VRAPGAARTPALIELPTKQNKPTIARLLPGAELQRAAGKAALEDNSIEALIGNAAKIVCSSDEIRRRLRRELKEGDTMGRTCRRQRKAAFLR